MTGDRFNLARFVEAQKASFGTAIRELHAARKESHWMWFIFPQLRGLGHSVTADFYGISSLDEARAYLAHPLLGPRLKQATWAMLDAPQLALRDILGSPDDVKFCSSMTLFALADEGDGPYQTALTRWCGGRPDRRTRALLGL